MNTHKAYHILRHSPVAGWGSRQNSHSAPRLAFGCVAVLLATGLGIVVLGLGSALGVYAYYSAQLPSAEEFSQRATSSFETTKIYDRTGTHLLYELIPSEGANRTYVPLHEIPVYMRYATIAIEDASFYTNPGGINLRGLFRAAWNNLRGLSVQGASSIASQLVRNVIMTPEERFQISYTRKIKEAVMAIELSRRYPGVEGKDKILEWYLNAIFYGRLANGVEAAAEAYFGKHASELDLAEAALLAQLPQYPALDPVVYADEAKKRQALVLDQMYLQGYITAEEAWAAKQETLNFVQQRFDITAPHFVMYVRSQLEDKFGADAVNRGGMKIYTTLDLDLQNEAERIAREQIDKVRDAHNVHNAAVVALDAKTGQILCMVGSLDYFDVSIDGQVNVAISERQPGSSFKPFTYVTAFMQGYGPASMVMDVRTSFPDDPNPPYVPENNDRKFRGPVRLRQALSSSLNVPAVAMLYSAGVKNVLDTAHRMGINTLNADFYGLSLTLGGGEVTLLDQTYAYSVFANEGIMYGEPVAAEDQKLGFRELNPVAILKIEDTQGNVIYDLGESQRREVLRPEPAFLINSILSDDNARAWTFGTGGVLNASPNVAVKTGTTTDYRDAWCIGYSTKVVVGVWVGNSDNKPMEHLPGSRGAGPIWRDIMDYLLKQQPADPFPVPDGVERLTVDATSGLLPTQYSPSTVRDWFVKDAEPKDSDNVHRAFRICRVSGKLATQFCPLEDVETKTFDIYPSEANDWVRESQIPQPPTAYCDLHGPTATTSDVAITAPAQYSCVKGVVTVTGNARPGDFRLFKLQYGQGMSPSAWIPIGGDHYNRVDNNVLEYWDVSQLPTGLFTLQLLVVEGNGNVRAVTIQVIVDNDPPQVEIIHPLDGAVYTLENDEWVNIQVDAIDKYAMDRVEYYLDGQPIGLSTVAPFTLKWTIALSDVLPTWNSDPLAVASTSAITSGQLRIEAQTLFDGSMITVTRSITDNQWITTTASYTTGRGVIGDSLGITETHVIKAVGFDKAGNQAESQTVRIYTAHKPKEEKQETPTPSVTPAEQPVGWLRRQWQIVRRSQVDTDG